MARLSLILAFFMFTAACATTMPVPPGVVDLKDESAAKAKAESAWGRVLTTYVDARGRIDIVKLSKKRQDLDAYIAWIAKCSPKTHPRLFADADVRNAHYINSYNALVIYGFLNVSDSLQDLKDPAVRKQLFQSVKFVIGKDPQTLDEYINNGLRPIEDPRELFALQCMAIGCPRLINRPYEPEALKKQLEEATREFLNNERFVQVDVDQQKVFLSEMLKINESDFVNEQFGNNILEYVNRYRDPRIPSKFKVEFLPIDWEFPRKPDQT